MTFESTLHKLANARSQYENMRSSGASTAELVDAQVALLYLRAEMAQARREHRR